MSILTLTLITALNLATVTSGTNEVTINQDHLYQHWVMSPSESAKGVMVYRPYQMAEQKNIPARLRHTGMIFEKGGKLRKNRWRKQGNESRSSFDHYHWQWKKQRGEAILNIASKIGNGQNYKVVQLNKDVLKISIIKRR